MHLWAYVHHAASATWPRPPLNLLRLVPVHESSELEASTKVVRLGDKRQVEADDWDFLSPYVRVVNPNWPRFLAEQRRSEDDNAPISARNSVAALQLLKLLELEVSSDVSKLIERVAQEFFSSPKPVGSSVRLAQIAAKLSANVGNAFRFVTRDRLIRDARADAVIFDRDGAVAEFLPPDWQSRALLHQKYATFSSCSREEWQDWVVSGRSALREFPPMTSTAQHFWGYSSISSEVIRRSGPSPSRPYVSHDFRLNDWDFAASLWSHWASLGLDDELIWARLLDRVIAQGPAFWTPALKAVAVQVATNGYARTIADNLVPGWAMRLRDLPCLRDTCGVCRKPFELLRRSAETEPLLELEPFVNARVDTEGNRSLLEVLGVRDKPADPGRLLQIIRVLAKTETRQPAEVDRWYRRLDQLMHDCPTALKELVRKAFTEERLILSEQGNWESASGVFLSADEEEAPGCGTVRASVRDLTLWQRVGIASRPSAELALAWLKQLPSATVLSQDEARRVLALQRRYPTRIWEELDHWLNLAREWSPVSSLKYALTMQSLIEWGHLHQRVKQQTADLRLPNDVTEQPPFDVLPRLAAQLEERPKIDPSVVISRAERRDWLSAFGELMSRVNLEEETQTARVRALAVRLSNTVWQTVQGLESVPFISGVPAGTPRRTAVAWVGSVLYVDQLPNAKLARVVPDRLSKHFCDQRIEAALNYCFGRSADAVAEYISENFSVSAAALKSMDSSSSDEPEETQGAALTAFQNEGDSATAVESESDQSQWDSEDDYATYRGVEPRLQSTPPGKERRRVSNADVMDRYASSQGFRRRANGEFVHADGSRILKASEDVFPWERRTARGELVRRYLPRAHCLERDPLEIDVTVWSSLEENPAESALVLWDAAGNPVEMRGSELLSLRSNARLVIYPARYRIVLRATSDLRA
jgi:hypothetical protein